jgi:type IV pilus assembly protein PilB
MDPYERFHRRSLRDVLVQQGALSNEQADELIDAAHQANEPFATVVLDAGALTSWDLAKTVATHYQMPVLPLVGYRFDKAIAQGLPASLLYQHQVLPVGRFGRTWSFAVIEPPSRDTLEDLKQACGGSMFFFVAEAQEVTRLLRENVKVMDVSSDTAWQSIFDEAQQNVLSESKVAPLPPPKTE